MKSRALGLVLGQVLVMTGVIVAASAGAQTVSSSASSSASVMPKPKPTAVKPVSATPKPATAVAKPAATPAPASAKPVTAASGASSSATSALATGAKPATPAKPAAPKIPAQPKTVPAECLTIDTTPFGALQALEVTGPTHAPVHFDVEIASAPSQRGQGLMCRQKLPATQGMLFEFPKASEQIFWMHDTVLPLDILYVAPDGHIVSITKIAYPLSEKKLPSHGLANGVLEINAGLADKLGLKAGDQVVYPFFVPATPVAPAVTAPVASSSSASSASSSESSGAASSPAQ